MKEKTEFDGIDLMPTFKGEDLEREAVFMHWPSVAYLPGGNIPATWVRKNNMKLIRFYCDGTWPKDRYELYDLSVDPGEIKDLTLFNGNHKYDDNIDELKNLIDKFLEETNALYPVPNPKYGEMLDKALSTNDKL